MFLVYIMSFRSCCISSLKAVIEFLDNSNNDLKDVIGSVTEEVQDNLDEAKEALLEKVETAQDKLDEAKKT